MGKIVSVTEKIPQPTTLPDGIYGGVWGGYIIEVQFNNKTYHLATEEGVRGIGIKVIVTIDGDDKTFQELKN